MYKKEFDGLIASGRVPNFVLLRGGDDFSNELYAQRLKQIYAAENFLSLYFLEYDFDAARSFLEPSLFGGSNTLHIKTASLIKKEELRRLIALCKSDANNHLIYELNDSEIAVSADFIKEFERNEVRFFKPSGMNEAIALLAQKCEMCGLFANTAALSRIYAIHNESLSLSASEIEKFASLGLELSLQNVNLMVYGLSEVSYDELFDKIFSLCDFRVDFYKMALGGGYNEMELINYFYRLIYRIFRLHAYVKINGRFDFKAVLGYQPPPSVAAQMQRYATSFSTRMFYKIFAHLNDLEFELKSEKNAAKDELLLASFLRLQRMLLSSLGQKANIK